MEPLLEDAVSEDKFMEEAFEELLGESTRKWALLLVALLLGVVVAIAVARHLAKADTDDT
jgi:hypothetical protein